MKNNNDKSEEVSLLRTDNICCTILDLLFFLINIVVITWSDCRCHCRNRCCTTKYGICQNRRITSWIWSLVRFFFFFFFFFWVLNVYSLLIFPSLSFYILYYQKQSTAFVGLAAYCFFATSKDISIGPTGK